MKGMVTSSTDLPSPDIANRGEFFMLEFGKLSTTIPAIAPDF